MSRHQPEISPISRKDELIDGAERMSKSSTKWTSGTHSQRCRGITLCLARQEWQRHRRRRATTSPDHSRAIVVASPSTPRLRLIPRLKPKVDCKEGRRKEGTKGCSTYRAFLQHYFASQHASRWGPCRCFEDRTGKCKIKENAQMNCQSVEQEKPCGRESGGEGREGRQCKGA